MIKINLSQLESRLESAKAQNMHFGCFLLIGSEPYLQHEAQKKLKKIMKLQGITQQYTFTVNSTTDWNNIFQPCQSLNLFSSKTLITLQCDEAALSVPVSQRLHELTTFLHEDIILIFSIKKLTKAQESSKWLTAISSRTLHINCHPLDTQYLPAWLNQRAKKIGINLDKATADLLCYYYEGNLLALSQILEYLKILYPDKKILVNHIEESINDSAIFSPYHWLDSIFSGKIKRTMHILKQFKNKGNEPLILLRTLQKELILLISLKKALVDNPLQHVFEQYKVWKSRRNLFSEIVNHLELKQLYEALNELTNIELHLKRDYNLDSWQALEKLSLKLVDKKLARSINYHAST